MAASRWPGRAVAAALTATLIACGGAPTAPSPAPAQLLAVARLTSDGAPVALAPVTVHAGATVDLWPRCTSDRATLHARVGGRAVHAACGQRALYRFEASLVGDHAQHQQGQIVVALRPRTGGAALASVSGAVGLSVVEAVEAAPAPAAGAAAPNQPPTLTVTLDGVVVDVPATTLAQLDRTRHPRLGAPMASLLRALAVPAARRIEVRGADGSHTTLEPSTFSPGRGRWAAIKRNRRGQIRVALVDGNRLARSLPTVVSLEVVTR